MSDIYKVKAVPNRGDPLSMLDTTGDMKSTYVRNQVKFGVGWLVRKYLATGGKVVVTKNDKVVLEVVVKPCREIG